MWAVRGGNKCFTYRHSWLYSRLLLLKIILVNFLPSVSQKCSSLIEGSSSLTFITNILKNVIWESFETRVVLEIRGFQLVAQNLLDATSDQLHMWWTHFYGYTKITCATSQPHFMSKGQSRPSISCWRGMCQDKPRSTHKYKRFSSMFKLGHFARLEANSTNIAFGAGTSNKRQHGDVQFCIGNTTLKNELLTINRH